MPSTRPSHTIARATRRPPKDCVCTVISAMGRPPPIRILERSCKIAGLEARDARLCDLLPGRGERALVVDRAAGVFDDRSGEAELARIERGPGHAEIGRQAAYEHALDAALLEIAFEARARLAVGLEEGGVAVDVLVVALADEKLRLRDREILVQRRAVASLHAVIGPQHLLAVGKLDRVEGLPPGMRSRERLVSWRMTVLRQHHVCEALRERVDDRHDLVALLNREPAAGAEVVLDIDH